MILNQKIVHQIGFVEELLLSTDASRNVLEKELDELNKKEKNI